MSSMESKQLMSYIRGAGVWNKPLEDVREDMKNAVGDFKYLSQAEITKINISGVNAEWIISRGAPENKVILYFHGGGYCLGIVDTNRNFIAKIAIESGYKVLLVDYRLAPEFPYPAAIEDAITVYRRLIAEGYTPGNIVIAGDSSGCGLGLVALTLLRDQGEPLPGALVFMTPAVDLSYNGESVKSRAEADPFQPDPKFYISNHYVADNDPLSPMLSPIYADMHDLPPLLIHAGDCDIFLSDSLRLAEKASDAGVDVKLKVWDEMWHIFHMYADYMPEGKAALEEIYSYIRSKLS